MYRWTERTGYRVIEIRPFDRAVVYALFVAVVLQFGPLLPLLYRWGWGGKGMEGLGPLFACVLAGLLVCGGFLRYWWRNTSWIELPTRPGPVRWSTKYGVRGETPGPVLKIEATLEGAGPSNPRYRLVAVSPAGDRWPLLARWGTRSREEVEGIVNAMNAEIRALDWDELAPPAASPGDGRA